MYFLLHHFPIIRLRGYFYVFDINNAVVSEYHVYIMFSLLKKLYL